MALSLAILGSAGIQGATSLAGGKKGASAATNAAQLQFQAAQQALQQQRDIAQTIQGYVQPFINYGTNALGSLSAAIPSLTAPIDTSLPSFTFQPTMADLAQTPGYQFTLQQAELAGQNALTSTGLGRSMSAVDTAAQIAGGVAANTWPQVFNAQLSGFQTNTNNLLAGRTMDLQQRQQIANILGGQAGIGLQGVGVGTGAAVPLAGQMASSITGAGAAQASGVVGAANALTAGLSGVGSAASSIPQSLILANAFGSGGGFSSLFGSQTADAGLAYMQNPNLMVGGTP